MGSLGEASWRRRDGSGHERGRENYGPHWGLLRSVPRSVKGMECAAGGRWRGWDVGVSQTLQGLHPSRAGFLRRQPEASVASRQESPSCVGADADLRFLICQVQNACRVSAEVMG